MRTLEQSELSKVAGAAWVLNGDGISIWVDDEPSAAKNNNGYGNGAEAGPPPGNSGAHNPQLTGWNEGPRGLR